MARRNGYHACLLACHVRTAPTRRLVAPHRCVYLSRLGKYSGANDTPATVPTISDAFDALSALADTLNDHLKTIANIGAELSARDMIRVEDVEDVRPRFSRCIPFSPD
jgi:hypothetical protein